MAASTFPKSLIGKTIKDIQVIHPYEHDHSKEKTDDEALLVTTTDGESYIIYGDYGGYTGNSHDEYPESVVIAKRRKQ